MATIKKISPKATRVIKTNKAPIVLDKKFALKEKAYADLDLETIKKRAELVRSSEKFCQNIQIINREAAEEKAQTKTQEDLLPEETLYEKFIPNKDTALFFILKILFLTEKLSYTPTCIFILRIQLLIHKII